MVRASRYDVVIIGAGINGAGIARDAAMRGLKVLLIEKGEVGAGTTFTLNFPITKARPSQLAAV